MRAKTWKPVAPCDCTAESAMFSHVRHSVCAFPILVYRSDYTGHDGDYFYRMNVCGPVSTGGPCGNALVCQYTEKEQRFVAKIAVYDGYFGPRLTLLDGNNPGAGVQAHYLNGDICFLGPQKRRTPRTTIIQYKCAAHGSDTFAVHEDKETCTFTITLESPVACWPLGSAGGISNGTSFLILSVERHTRHMESIGMESSQHCVIRSMY